MTGGFFVDDDERERLVRAMPCLPQSSSAFGCEKARRQPARKTRRSGATLAAEMQCTVELRRAHHDGDRQRPNILESCGRANLPMSFDPASLFVSLIVGSVGLVLFIYGKKEARFPQLIAGLLLMVYPYFTSNVESTVAVGLLIVAGLWFLLKLGL